MAKKSALDVMFREVTRGFGRQLGRDISRGVQTHVKKKVLDNTSTHRKFIDRFTLPGTFRSACAKTYTLIESFNSEYVLTNAMFQASFYLQSDIAFIEEKLAFIERLVFTDAEERAYERLIQTWVDYKEKSLIK